MIGELSALLTALCWSGSSLAFASASSRAGSVLVNILRLAIAAVLLLLVALAFGLSLRVSTSQLIALSVSGVIGLVFGDSFLFKSYVHNGARLSMLVMSLAPAISAILAFVVLGEVVSFWAVVGMAVTLGGIVIVVMDRAEPSHSSRKATAAGLFYAFLGAVGQGAGLIPAKMAFEMGDLHGLIATFYRIAASLILMLPLLLFSRRLKDKFILFRRDPKSIGGTFIGAILGPCLGITLSLIAISNTSIAVAATLMATVPIMMLPLVRVVYRERPTLRGVGGAFVAVAGVAILFLR